MKDTGDLEKILNEKGYAYDFRRSPLFHRSIRFQERSEQNFAQSKPNKIKAIPSILQTDPPQLSLTRGALFDHALQIFSQVRAVLQAVSSNCVLYASFY
jgi:hypothetical protein